jgi:hypothetical protein
MPFGDELTLDHLERLMTLADSHTVRLLLAAGQRPT